MKVTLHRSLGSPWNVTKVFSTFSAAQIIVLLQFTHHYGHRVATAYQCNQTTGYCSQTMEGKKPEITRPHKPAHCWQIHGSKQLHHYVIYSYIHNSILTAGFKPMIKPSWFISIAFSLPSKLCLSILPAEDYGPEETRRGKPISTFFPCRLRYNLQAKSKIQGSFLPEKKDFLVAVCSVRHFINRSQEIEKDWWNLHTCIHTVGFVWVFVLYLFWILNQKNYGEGKKTDNLRKSLLFAFLKQK